MGDEINDIDCLHLDALSSYIKYFILNGKQMVILQASLIQYCCHL